MNAPTSLRICYLVCSAALLALPLRAHAQRTDDSSATAPAPATTRESMSDARWTGPMLAPSAATLPRGHILVEPYLFDVVSNHTHSFGSLTYALFGVTDKLTMGFIPTAGFNVVRGGPNSGGIGFGDLTAVAQYSLTRFREGRWVPATAIVLEETFPTGKFDQLGDRPSDGFGGGAYTTLIGLYSQKYFWLPNGRILRARLDVTHTFSTDATVRDVSAYGTATGFRGRASPGNTSFIDAAAEYSLTRSWVLALDVTYRHGAMTSVSGYDILDPPGTPRPSIQYGAGP
ncbi:MAG: hypothetical protein JJD97_12480, partial [Gemmatimonadaceae bacterium]|nr:hypothetical protein [Gemmatimonadaceae bacterium]